MPNKTIYVADGDLPLYQRAQELAGGSLSAAITTALRRYVDQKDGQDEGFEEITVKVGIKGAQRKQRFVGLRLGEWNQNVGNRVEMFRIYRARSGRFVLHVERSEDWHYGSEYSDKRGGRQDWRTVLGIGIGDTRWGVIPAESRLEVFDTLDEMRDKIPTEYFELVTAAAAMPPVEDLDI